MEMGGSPRSACNFSVRRPQRNGRGAFCLSAAVLTLAGDARSVAAASVWAGAVGMRPAPLPAVAEGLAGVPLAAIGDVLAEAAARGAETCPVDEDIHGSEDYKRHLVAVLTERAVRRAAGTERERRAG